MFYKPNAQAHTPNFYDHWLLELGCAITPGNYVYAEIPQPEFPIDEPALIDITGVMEVFDGLRLEYPNAKRFILRLSRVKFEHARKRSYWHYTHRIQLAYSMTYAQVQAAIVASLEGIRQPATAMPLEMVYRKYPDANDCPADLMPLVLSDKNWQRDTTAIIEVRQPYVTINGSTVGINNGCIGVESPWVPDQKTVDTLKKLGFKWQRQTRCWARDYTELAASTYFQRILRETLEHATERGDT